MNSSPHSNTSRTSRLAQPRPIFRTKAFVKGVPPTTARPLPARPVLEKPEYPSPARPMHVPPGMPPPQRPRYTTQRAMPQGRTDTRIPRPAILPPRLKEGDLVEGVVSNVADFGVFVQLSNKNFGLVHISRVSHVKVDNLADLFRAGDKIKAVVAAPPTNPRKLVLSTKRLETTPGQILDEPAAVYAAAANTMRSYASLTRPQPPISPFELVL